MEEALCSPDLLQGGWAWPKLGQSGSPSAWPGPEFGTGLGLSWTQGEPLHHPELPLHLPRGQGAALHLPSGQGAALHLPSGQGAALHQGLGEVPARE
jgi:hypothetical protein